MPKDTWHNLPPEKRNRVLAVATAEFVAHGYTDASLNRIANQAEIAKGSLFQYFENKLDMWATITGAAAARGFAAASAAVVPKNSDEPFTWLEQFSLALIRHLRDHHDDRVLIAATIDSTEASARATVRETTNDMYNRVVGGLVSDAVNRGEIDPARAPECATFVILLLRFLANAPFTGDRDPILDLHNQSWPDIEATTRDLVQALRAAFVPDER